MKVAILGARGIPARYGGFETFAEKLAVGLFERGFDVTVFCESGEVSASDVFHGVKLRYVSAPSLGPLTTVFYDLKCLWAARKGYDLVYMLGYGAAPFCVIPRLGGAKVWINPDGLEWARAKWGFVARNYFRLMEWISLHASNRIIADAEAIATSLASRHGKLRACTVIPYGCEVIETPLAVEPLSQWNLVPNSYFLVVARLEPENQVLEMLQAFQQSRSNMQLVVVGNHLAESQYVERLRAVRDPRIRMIGAVYDQHQLACLRYHCFAYLHGHTVGGTNPSLLEAMGCGNLIVAHDNPFNREVLGEYAFFFGGTNDLTSILDRIEEDESTQSRMRSGAQLRAMDHYSWPSIIERYISLMQAELPSPGDAE